MPPARPHSSPLSTNSANALDERSPGPSPPRFLITQSLGTLSPQREEAGPGCQKEQKRTTQTMHHVHGFGLCVHVHLHNSIYLCVLFIYVNRLAHLHLSIYIYIYCFCRWLHAYIT